MIHSKLLINSLFERMPWNILKAILQKHNLPLGRGCDATKDKILSLLNEKLLPKETIDSLDNYYLRFFHYGDKTVSFSTMNEKPLLTFIDEIELLSYKVNADDINFPYRDKETDKLLTEKSKLVYVENEKDGVTLTYVSLKSIIEKISLDEDYFQQINASFELPKDIFEVTAKKKVCRRYYDTVFIRHSDLSIEYRLDTASFASKDDLDRAFYHLNETFLADVRSIVGGDKLQFSYDNLSQVVPALYAESLDRVCELGFNVGSVVHHEKMRAKRKDLRNEKFHLGGKSEVKSISVFRIAIRKPKKLGDTSYEVELYLPGISKMLSASNPEYLKYAIVSNCITNDSYEELISSMKECQYIHKINLEMNREKQGS